MVLVVWAAAGQTQIDLNTQAKNAPIKSGASLPGTCTAGQVYFLTNAATGANLYGCTAANTWSVQGGQGGGGTTLQGTLANMPPSCTAGQLYFATDAAAGANLYGCPAANTWASEGGSETVRSNGVPVGARPTTNFQTGPGLLSVITDTGTAINIQSAVDTAVVATLPGEQTGSSLLCSPASGTATSYNCSMTPTATTYTVGMVLHWIPDMDGTGGPTTLNVDTLGAKGVKQADGVSDPGSGDIVAGSMREVWYDGVNLRFLETGQVSGGGSGSVASVFGRTGPVLGMAGDYTAVQVTNAAATNASNTFTAGTQDFSGAAHTRPMIVVGAVGNLPGACVVGELAFVSGQTAGQQIYECSTANVWTQQSGGSGGGGGAGQAPVFGTYESRPTCNSSVTGQIFRASDISNKHWECDGNAWQPIAFDMRVVEPTSLSWTATGPGAVPTVASVGGALVVTASASGGWEVAATPISLSTPYTIEVAFTFMAQFSGNYDGCGLVLFSSTPPTFSGQTWMAWFVGSRPNTGVTLPPLSLTFFDEYGDNMSSYSGQQVVPVIRAELVDDGTNRTFYLNNGAGYFQVFQQSDAAGNTPHNPGYWGVGCGVGSGEESQLVLYSASVHH
jgi:hypothetical protein